jgi:hypothetical protein
MSWTNLYGFQEKAGQQLNGQLVFPHRDADDVVVVRLFAFTLPLVFRAPNKLTEETGGTLIHFLSHLDRCCVYRLQVQADLPELSDERGEPIGALNPRIFNAYRAVLEKPLRLYACGVETGVVPINETSLRTARQLVNKFRGVCYSSHAQEVDEMLALLTTARPDCSMIDFHAVYSGRHVDRFVEVSSSETRSHKMGGSDGRVAPLQYYRDYSGDIDSLVPEVHLFNVFNRIWEWPATCPREDAQVLMVESWRADFETEYATRQYTYTFENAASGRRFKVILGANCTRSIQQGEGGQIIRDEERTSLSRATLLVLRG